MTISETIYCSFCGKSQHKVRKLIEGRDALICDECVDLCVDILDTGDQSTSDATRRLKQIASISAQLDWLRLRLDALSGAPEKSAS